MAGRFCRPGRDAQFFSGGRAPLRYPAGIQGRALFDLDSSQSVSLLAYSAGTFLGRSVNGLLRQSLLRYTTVYETAIAGSLGSDG